MAACNVLSLVVLALVSAAFANPAPDTTTPTTTTGATGATGYTSGPSGINDYLTDEEKAKVCACAGGSSNGSTSAGPAGNSTSAPEGHSTSAPAGNSSSAPSPSGSGPLCATPGAADTLCNAAAAAANGKNATCVACNLCSFHVDRTEPITTTPSSVSTTSTSTTTTTASPNAASTTQAAPLPVTPGTVYVSWAPVPHGLAIIKTCDNSPLSFVYPCGGNSTGSTASATSTTAKSY